MGLLISLLVISILIFVHELGHFMAARFFGVHVEVFSIGFGKRLLTKKIGNTQWSLSAIPLGGYVKMKGQDDTNPLNTSFDNDSYNVKKPWQKIIILLAGPLSNFLLAFLIYIMMTFVGIPKLLPQVGEISPNSPAKTSGLLSKDMIISIDNEPMAYWEDIGQKIQATQSKNLTLKIKREDAIKTIQISPKILTTKNIFGEEEKRYMIGIAPLGSSKIVYFNFVESIEYASKQTLQTSLLIFTGIEKLITGVVDTKEIGGIITIFDTTSKASDAGILSLLFFTALISINLGVLNLLPIPALDGGHIMFNLYEMIRGKAPSEAIVYKLTLGGWVILFGLMFLGLFNDINRLWG
ncbi:putative membrane-associated zinc metalloprotease [Sulfurovum sp. enrichment culture clone C5]|uniref:Zinc metalloprotease n=1 Tax=Sulfurovum sp. enrichment culture clone C5 TaxID=497650 RepID=A0A0S4XMC5_9BACT|nr:putative membrane-associated zinc metalloprotease [Sulfurovum sp. enrichment culture clone C5]